MSLGFNDVLAEQIEQEMLSCQVLIESTLTNREGTFKLFVRNGSLQKAWPVPRKNVTLLNDDDEEGIRYSVYKDIIADIMRTLAIQDAPFEFGYIIVTYKANAGGDELEEFNLRFGDEIHFAREKKKSN